MVSKPHLSRGDMGRARDETTPSRDHASSPLMLILEGGCLKSAQPFLPSLKTSPRDSAGSPARTLARHALLHR